MVDLLFWRIVPRPAPGRPPSGALPEAVLTIGPRFRHEGMPGEVAMLLPTNVGPNRLIDAVVAQPDRCAGAVLGLFLANPFLNVALESRRLHGAGVAWITNLPSVDQQDSEFARQLPDVGLDAGRELESLARFRTDGFRVAVVVADAASATAAAAIGPEALIVMPRVADFAAGFPSLRQRGTAVQAVAEAARDAGWSGTLLGLGEAREADNPRLWPPHLDGLICRPTPFTGAG